MGRAQHAAPLPVGRDGSGDGVTFAICPLGIIAFSASPILSNCPVREIELISGHVGQRIYPNGKLVVSEEMKNTPYGKISTPAELGALLRRRRKEAGVLQADAAALSNVGTRFLSELERGKPTAELGKVLLVLARLGLELYVVPRGAAPTGEDES